MLCIQKGRSSRVFACIGASVGAAVAFGLETLTGSSYSSSTIWVTFTMLTTPCRFRFAFTCSDAQHAAIAGMTSLYLQHLLTIGNDTTVLVTQLCCSFDGCNSVAPQQCDRVRCAVSQCQCMEMTLTRYLRPPLQVVAASSIRGLVRAFNFAGASAGGAGGGPMCHSAISRLVPTGRLESGEYAALIVNLLSLQHPR